jgi:hypothetical protein
MKRPVCVYVYIYIYIHAPYYYTLYSLRHISGLVEPSSEKYSSRNYTLYLSIHFHEKNVNVNTAFHTVLRLLLVSQEGLRSLDFVSCVQY